MSRVGIALLACALGLPACTTETVQKPKIVQGTAVDHGLALFSDPLASPSSLNAFSCATCHRATNDAGGASIFTGAMLAGVTERPSFWAGQENDLLRSINDCRFYFMEAQKPWTVDDEEAKAMYAYLASLPPTTTAAVSFTVVASVADVPPGDAAAGARVFVNACQSCHGAVHTGEGRLTERAVKLPDDTLVDHAEYSIEEQRVVFVEKIRHGTFLGYAGSMPPYSKEALSDADLSDLLSYFQLYK